MVAEPWNKDSTASRRALDNAVDVERTALNLLVDIQAGAFAGADTTRPIEKAIEYLKAAQEIARQRWETYLNSLHEKAA